MIYFEVWAGLCNRLRGMASAYAFAQSIGEPLTVIWESDVNCNCRFDNIFTLNRGVDINILYYDCMGTSFAKKIEHQKNKIHKKYIQSKCDIIYKEDPLNMDIYKLKKDVPGKNVYIKSFSYWYPSNSPFDFFTLKPAIKEKVDMLVDKCGTKKVGVHIRRTDHEICIHNSPTEAFVDAMKKESQDTIFYVASDDIRERQKLEEIFGQSRIIYNNNAELSRGTEKGMEDAAIDLYALSGMSKILGSDTSSFTEVAGMITGIPVIVCK